MIWAHSKHWTLIGVFGAGAALVAGILLWRGNEASSLDPDDGRAVSVGTGGFGRTGTDAAGRLGRGRLRTQDT